MRAMILAAGMGKRMRPLTEHVPKPLLKVGGKCLIEFHLEKLAAAGIQEVVINTHWLASQIPAYLGNGDKWGLRLHYSHEPELLETAGGIVQALNMLSDENEPEFLLVNGDIYCEVDFQAFLKNSPTLGDQLNAHLAMVDNPEHNQKGDFTLANNGMLSENLSNGKPLTYAGLAVFHRDFFNAMSPGPALLGPLLREAMTDHKISGEHLNAYWLDVGTPERLQSLDLRIESLKRQKTDSMT